MTITSAFFPTSSDPMSSSRPSVRAPARVAIHRTSRSEEHTSELQSPCNLVCRLLLEKKKTQVSPLHIWPLCLHQKTAAHPTSSVPVVSSRSTHAAQRSATAISLHRMRSQPTYVDC